MKWTNWEKVAGTGFDFTEIIYEKKFHMELRGGVARITVNRPDKYNAFTAHSKEEMFRAFYDASHDCMVGVVVLTGAGKHFGTGGDVEWEKWGQRQSFYYSSPPNRLVRACRKPVIAAVKGYCIGGSSHLAYCCDFTIASTDSIFGQNGPRVGSPADGYYIPYLVRVAGAKRAREIWMLCRRYSASEALSMGLVNKVVPLEKLEEEVDRWCEEILSLSPGCLEILKAAFDMEIDSMPVQGAISSSLYPDWFDSEEFKEGNSAFREKRKANFWLIREKELEAKKENSKSGL